MLEPVGFWSYARQDDAHSDDQLSQLRAIVGRAIARQCGLEVTLWQDISAIPYDADWADEIERAIAQTTFFIPIVTPRFLKSMHCRDEFLAFRRRMQSLGRSDLIFPIHYVRVDDVNPEETVFGDDDLAALRRSHWIDFRPLFYSDPKSPEVRRWAGELAGSVLRAMRHPTAAKPSQEGACAAPIAQAAPAPPPSVADPWGAEEATAALGAPAKEASKSIAGEPQVSPSASEAQRVIPRASDAPALPELTIPVQPSARGIQGGASRTGLLIVGAVAIAFVIALAVAIFQRWPPEVPGTSGPTTPPLTSAAPSPGPTPVERAPPAPTPTSVPEPHAPYTGDPLAARNGPTTTTASGSAMLSIDGLGNFERPVTKSARALLAQRCRTAALGSALPIRLCPGQKDSSSGSPASDPGKFTDEGPQHGVRIAKPWRSANFLWRSMSSMPSRRKPAVTRDRLLACGMARIGNCKEVACRDLGLRIPPVA